MLHLLSNYGYIFLSDPAKKTKKKKKWYNLGCCKTMQFEIGDLAMKNNFVHCLQRLVHYFKGKSIYF